MKKIFFLLILFQSGLFFSQSGSLDTSFNAGSAVFLGSYSSRINAIALQSDGKIILGGNFTSFNGTSVRALTRLNFDGSIDPSFAIGQGFDYINSTGNTLPNVNSIVIQPDGKIIVVGYFSSFNGIFYKTNIIRLNSDGSIDASFDTVNFGDRINTVVLQSDGKILVGGYFKSYFTIEPTGVFNSIPCNSILRLNTDGTVDNSFNIGSGPLQIGGFSVVNKIIVQPDDKILVGGSFYAFDNQYGNNLARLNSDGSVDSSFQIGVGFQNGTNYSQVNDIDVLPNGSMFITGDFTTFDGLISQKHVKLLPNGYKDWSFAIDSALNLNIKSTSVQINGKIVLCATGTNNGVYIWNVIRLNVDGTNDDTFVTGTNFNDLPFFSVIQSDGNILFSGPFTTFDGAVARNIARIIGDPPTLNNIESKINELSIYPNPAVNNLNLLLPNDTINKIIINDSTGKTVMIQTGENNTIDIQDLANGMYYIQVFADKKSYQTKFIKE